MLVIAGKKRSLVAGFHPGYRCREVLEDEIGIMTGLDDEIFRFIGNGWRLFHPTTIYLWLRSLAASKELSILLLKLLKCKSNRYSDFILGLRARTAVC